MKSYSQSAEDEFVLNYFQNRYKVNNYPFKLLEIGANDGITLSNSRRLIQNGWHADLVEPGPVYTKLFLLYNHEENVRTHNFAVASKYGTVVLHNSGAHVPNGVDEGLVSTISEIEKKRWPNVQFTAIQAQAVPFKHFLKYAPFHFISIDAEGFDLEILKQIDLAHVCCDCLCIEWNSDPWLLEQFTNYCTGYTLAVKNAENLIFVK